MTGPELLEIVYRFYPRGLRVDGPGYDDSPQRRHMLDVARRGAAEYPRWKAMLRRLATRYSVYDCALHIAAGNAGPAYAVKLGIPGQEGVDDDLVRRLGFHMRLGCHVSLLGPYYVVRHTGSADEQPYISYVAREVESTYGYEPVPPELGHLVVPDVAVDNVKLGEATIYNCLLATHWPPSPSDIERSARARGLPMR